VSDNQTDLHHAPLDGSWVKSSYSNGADANCVRLMAIAGGVALGDSKRPDLTPLRHPTAQLHAFLHAVETGRLTP
jgi:hypothetical protein